MMSPLSRFTVALISLSMLRFILAVPLATKLRSLSSGARDILKRSTPAAPRFFIYQDKWSSSLPSTSELQGYNVYALSFWLTSGAADMALSWQQLTSSERTSYVQEYNAAGISLIVSAFGSTDTPTSSGDNAVTVANDLATWVTTYGVQGVDVDYEDFNAFNSTTAVNWLVSFTQQLRTQLPQSEYILSHAPVAPWFSPNLWTGGGYLEVHKSVGSSIDWYNVQFYNQGSSEYTTCSGLLTTSSSTWPGSALFQISANGVDLSKLVIGKPATSSDANNGYMDPSTLASCVSQAYSSGWSGGVMVWQYPDAGSSWISTVRGNTWPISGSSTTSPTLTPTTTTTTTTIASSSMTSATSSSPSPTTTAPSGSGSCAGISAWASNVAYTSGEQVTYNGHLWTAKWWNEDETPGGTSGAWTDDGACT